MKLNVLTIALAATAFSLAILVAEQAASFRGAVAPDQTIHPAVNMRVAAADNGSSACCR